MNPAKIKVFLNKILNKRKTHEELEVLFTEIMEDETVAEGEPSLLSVPELRAILTFHFKKTPRGELKLDFKAD